MSSYKRVKELQDENKILEDKLSILENKIEKIKNNINKNMKTIKYIKSRIHVKYIKFSD